MRASGDWIADEIERRRKADAARIERIADPMSRWLARREASAWRALRARRLQLAADDYINGGFAFAELYGYPKTPQTGGRGERRTP